MLNKFERFVRTYSDWSANLGTVLMLAILAAIFIDIVGSKLFTWPLPGSIELIEFSQVLMIPLATAITQLFRQHIRVEIVTSRLPKPAIAIIDSIVSLILLCVFIVIVWQVFKYGISIQESGEYSISLHLPIHYFIYIMALALVPACFVFLLDLVHSVKSLGVE